MVELLVRHGADVNLADAMVYETRGNSHLADTALDAATREKHDGVIEFLRRHGAKTSKEILAACKQPLGWLPKQAQQQPQSQPASR
jgi:ankyrin repeat protein